MGRLFLLFTVVPLVELYLLIAVGEVSWIMYVSAALQFNSIVTVIIRSQCSKFVEPSEVGRIFSVVAFGQALVPLISNPIYGLLYRATIDSFPGAYLLVVDGLLVFACATNLYLWCDSRKEGGNNRPLTQIEDEENEQ